VTEPRAVGIAGFGTVGRVVAEALLAGIDGLVLGPIAVRDMYMPGVVPETFRTVRFITNFDELAAAAPIVVECAPPALFGAIATPVLTRGGTLIALSAAALLDLPELPDLARAHGGRIIVPSGSLLGLDAVSAAAQGRLHKVRLITRKPPAGFAGAPFLVERDIEVTGITAPMRLFAGTAREAARSFPANVNVAAALALAGLGPDRTEVEIWADPTVDRNRHTVEVDSDSASFTMTIEGIPSSNPKTSRLTARSVIATLRKLTAPLVVGG
jgi:aspartate dehydrogenase